MLFRPTELRDAYVVEIQRLEDSRGFFGRSFCRREFMEHGLNPVVDQCNVSVNKRSGTLRGMHYQAPPHQEAKLVRCTKGAIFDAIIDLRPESPTFKQHFSVILSEQNLLMLYIPEGFAHGFQTLEDDTEVFYQMSESFHPESSRGVRWDDPAFGINWPPAERIINDRDRNYPDFAVEPGARL